MLSVLKTEEREANIVLNQDYSMSYLWYDERVFHWTEAGNTPDSLREVLDPICPSDDEGVTRFKAAATDF